MDRELSRQIFHLVLGFAAIMILVVLGRYWLMAGTFLALIIGTLLMNQLTLGRRVGLVDIFIKYFERKEVFVIGWGSAAYTTGVLMLATVLENVPEIAAGIFILAVGDSFSTIIGAEGKHRLPYNRKKTVEGTIAFFIFSLPAYLFVGPAIIPVALVAALVEGLDIPLDDNLVIPAVCSVMFLLLG